MYEIIATDGEFGMVTISSNGIVVTHETGTITGELIVDGTKTAVGTVGTKVGMKVTTFDDGTVTITNDGTLDGTYSYEMITTDGENGTVTT